MTSGLPGAEAQSPEDDLDARGVVELYAEQVHRFATLVGRGGQDS